MLADRDIKTSFVAVVVIALSCCMLAGCGGNSTQSGKTSGQTTSNNAERANAPGGASSVPSASGRVVDASRVPDAIKHVGFQIILRAGRTPPQFVGSVYGTARNSHGASVNFGIFMSGDQNASRYFVPSLSKLVPGATREGSTSGESWIAVTSAGAGGSPGSRKAEEEFSMAGTLQERVAGLARKALEEEGP
jgi:hypothetical protein